MQKFTLAFIVAQIALFPALASCAETVTPTCDQVAKQVAYVQPVVKSLGDQRVLDVGFFRVHLPLTDLSRLWLTSEGQLRVLYSDNAMLTLRSHSVPDEFLPWTKRKPGEGKITTTDMADITFMKTDCDKGPAEEVDLKRWKRAIYEKGLYFDNATEVIKTQFGKLTYYLSNDNHQGYTGHAFITHSVYRHTTLIITAVGIPYKDFKKIVLNITEREL